MQAMPSAPQPAAVAVSRPDTIAMAVRLMYVGAALTVIGALLTIFMRDSIRASVVKSAATSGASMTSSEIDAAVTVAVGLSVVIGLIGAGLWLWMASANGKGRRWARTVATVFFALNVVSTLGSVIQHPPVLSLVVGIVGMLLGAYIIYLLYRPDSTGYYEAQSAPTY
jgi:hypothetical protein